MMMMMIIGWGGIGGGCAASSTDDRFPTIAISPSLAPPPAPAPPRRDAESPSVPSSSVPRSLPYHLATTLLRGFVHPPSHWGGGTICLRADRIGDMLRTLKSAPGGRRRTGSFLVRFRSSVRPSVRLRRRTMTMTMTPDILDFCTRPRRYGTVPYLLLAKKTRRRSADDRRGGGGRTAEDDIDTQTSAVSYVPCPADGTTVHWV